MSVRHALLALLSEGPKYGLQLREEFEAGTGEVWPLNVGQVYTTLQRLERDGLVESEGDGQDGPPKGFLITPAGLRELTRWLRTPPGLAAPPRDELVMKVLVAGRVPGTDVRDVIQPRSMAPPPRRAGDEGAGRGAGAGDRRAGRDPGAPQVPGGADAAVDPDQGNRGRVRPEPGPGGRRGAVPA